MNAMKNRRDDPRRRGPARTGKCRTPKAPHGSIRCRTLAVFFPALADCRTPAVGLGAVTMVVEALGGGTDVQSARAQTFLRGRRANRLPNAAMEQAARRVCGAGGIPALAAVLAALGSVHRLAILAQLLEGPATYRALGSRTRLKAGPLYHHINQLRLAGLVGPKTRDTYVLTRAGRNAVLAALAMRSLLKDTRPRPKPG
ncbi:MAG: hypothetical protein ACPMAQ_16885 [Phycisphaerae bacterium]